MQRAKSTFGLAVLRRYQKILDGQALRCEKNWDGLRIVEMRDPIHKSTPLYAPRGNFRSNEVFEINLGGG
ncbi:hypothetical protein ACTGJ9_039485 [Bradyrhizobium sp. RDM12]